MPEPKTFRITPPTWRWVGNMAKDLAIGAHNQKACQEFIEELTVYAEFNQQLMVLINELIQMKYADHTEKPVLPAAVHEQLTVIEDYLKSWNKTYLKTENNEKPSSK